MMKYIRTFGELNESAELGKVEQLIALGLVDILDFLRIEYEINDRHGRRLWEILRSHTPGSQIPAPGLFPIAKWWPAPKGYEGELFKASSGDIPLPRTTSFADLQAAALELDLDKFIDRLDQIVLDDLQQKFSNNPKLPDEGPVLLVNARTRGISQLKTRIQESAGNASRLLTLSLLP